MGETTPVSDAVRAKGREIAQRLKDDAAYRQHIEADPSTVLREAGLPEETHPDFLRETGIEPDVAGYRAAVPVCQNDLTCIRTCFISTW